MPRLAPPIAADPGLVEARQAWRTSMQAAGRSPKTISTYLYAIDQLIEYLGPGTKVAAVTRRDLEALQGSLLGRLKPSSVLVIYGALRSFWAWAAKHEDMPVAASPMAGMTAPKVPSRTIEFVTDEELKAILATTHSTSTRNYLGRRDEAIIRLFATTAVRLAELSNLRVNDVDLEAAVFRVLGKGRRERWVPMDADTTLAVRRYLTRERPRHPQADGDWLWLSRGQRMTDSGIAQMVAERGYQALGKDHRRVHPHELRHRSAAAMLEAGMSEGDVMEIGGWRNRSMLDRYGAFTRGRRAHNAYRRAAASGALPKL